MSSGQWYLISSAFVASALFAISVLYSGYFTTSFSDVATLNEDYYFNDIKAGMRGVAKGDMPAFVYFSESELQKSGYYVDISAGTGKVTIKTANMDVSG